MPDEYYYEFAVSTEVSASSLQEAERKFAEAGIPPLNAGYLLISSDPNTYSWLDEQCGSNETIQTGAVSLEHLLTPPHSVDLNSWERCEYDNNTKEFYYRKRIGGIVMSARKHINGGWWGCYGVNKNPFLFTSGRLYDKPELAMNDVKLELYAFLMKTVKDFYNID